ncbi:MAG: 4-hydroxybenzoate octaprenyltransferase [Hyphomicrobiales bacterium]|nr:4-hydroxybenzoate octaprenyltransferase [Hyphomicrobiales bacterium]
MSIKHQSISGPPEIVDATPGGWVSRTPHSIRPFLQLMRADRPIGVWLLLWPCWWSAALAAMAAGRDYPNLWHMALFAVGAFAMRSAGCIYNDIADRHYDAKVARTRNRPIASGRISPRAAAALMVALSLCGLAVLLQFNTFTITLGMGSLGVVAIYPFMKRITHWPQAVLGLAFSWGALMGWAAAFGRLDWPALTLYAAAVLWTIGYDTIYAHQDKEDDAIVGLKSTALRFGVATKYWLVGFYGAALILIGVSGWLVGAGIVFFVGVCAALAHAAWQIVTLDINEGNNCLSRFRSNHAFGALIFVALASDIAFKSLM